MKTLVHRRQFLASASLIPLAAASVGLQAAEIETPPNIVFIMADDLGYADLSCYGRRDYITPNIDRLAEQGMRFTSAYANSAVCSATRTALITGNYQYRLPVGLEEPLAFRNLGLPPGEPTLPSLMQESGYATALIGKWHLGTLPDYGPLQSGYEHFWGFRGGGVDYFTHGIGENHDLWDGDTEVHQTGYLTDLLGDRAISTIGQFASGSRPFFLSLHFSAPHWPWEGLDSEEESARLRATGDPYSIMHYDGGTQEIFAEMVTRLDLQVGRILYEIERLGLVENTIVVFTSDNGGERFSDTYPFSGRKTELLEGGLRIPTIVRWPGHVEPESTSDAQIMSMDWLPTFLKVANTNTPEGFTTDGMDLADVLAGNAAPERELFWRYKNHDQRAARRGDWKYLRIAGNEFLFNVIDDPMEKANLKNRFPDIFEELKASFENWEEEMLPFDQESYTHGFSGSEMADHFGVGPDDIQGLPANPGAVSPGPETIFD